MRFLVLKSRQMWISAFQLESDSFGDVTAFLLTQPAYTFCNTRRKKKKTRHPPLQKKKSFCAFELVQSGSRFFYILHEYLELLNERPLRLLWRSGSIDSFCCWSWQQMRDWERPLGCKRKGNSVEKHQAILERGQMGQWESVDWIIHSTEWNKSCNAAGLQSYLASVVIWKFSRSSCLRGNGGNRFRRAMWLSTISLTDIQRWFSPEKNIIWVVLL